MPIDQLGAGIATLTTTMPTSQAITSFNQAIMAFIKPTQEAAEVAAQYGFEMSAAALEQKGFIGMLEEIRQKTGGEIVTLGINTLGVLYIVENGNAVRERRKKDSPRLHVPTIKNGRQCLLS